MRILIIPALAASIALAGCQTQLDIVDAAVRKALPVACEGLKIAKASFDTFDAVKPLPASYRASAVAAYASAQGFCDHPETATAMKAILTIYESARTISKILADAEAAGRLPEKVEAVTP